jgi:hypothetical protein
MNDTDLIALVGCRSIFAVCHEAEYEPPIDPVDFETRGAFRPKTFTFLVS